MHSHMVATQKLSPSLVLAPHNIHPVKRSLPNITLEDLPPPPIGTDIYGDRKTHGWQAGGTYPNRTVSCLHRCSHHFHLQH